MPLRFPVAFLLASLVSVSARAQDDARDANAAVDEDGRVQASEPAAEPAPVEDEPRLIVGFGGAVIFPLATPHLEALWPGATFAVAAHASLTKWLMPTLRLRGGILADQGASNAFPDPGVGTLLQGMGGIRFRPRGIAHPEEVPRGTCIWAEVDAGIGLWNGHWQPIFEATIGFDFEVGPVDLGPVVHFTHVLPTRPADGPDTFLLSVGLEVLVNDARGPSTPH
jgi:hypothetical protein